MFDNGDISPSRERYEHYYGITPEEHGFYYNFAADRLADMGSVPVERVTDAEIKRYMRRKGWSV